MNIYYLTYEYISDSLKLGFKSIQTHIVPGAQATTRGMGWRKLVAKAQSSPITDTHSLSRVAGFLLFDYCGSAPQRRSAHCRPVYYYGMYSYYRRF